MSVSNLGASPSRRQVIKTQECAAGTAALPVRYASRGQALIMAVLIMFLLAGLAGLFIAMINQALVETARAVDRAKLEEIAQAGLHQVQAELQYSPEGSDWRPDAGPDHANRGWISYAEGFYKVTVGYGPNTEIGNGHAFRDNPLDRLVKIDIEARYALQNVPQMDDQNDPSYTIYENGYRSKKRFLTRKITAFMPIGLTDNVRWITNMSGSTEPVVLGNGLTYDNLKTVSSINMADDQLNNAGNQATASAICYSMFVGPVRSETSLKLGNALFYLTNGDPNYKSNCAMASQVNRQDLIEVVGALTSYENSSARAVAMINANNQSIASGVDLRSGSVALPVQYLETKDNNPLIRPMKAPRLDQVDPVSGIDRYRALTRDSLFSDLMSSSASSATAWNLILGRGDGVYIDNHEEIQYNGDTEALQQEWLNPTDNTNVESCWDAETHRIYDPVNHGKAIEIDLGDWMQSASGTIIPPMITLKWDSSEHFFDRNGNPIKGQSTQIPYPRNGVIFAEGNVTVKGYLPASVAYTHDNTGNVVPYYDEATQPVQRPGGYDPRTAGISYYVSDLNRRYDLTIVSGGTVYIDGSVLGPASRNATYKRQGQPDLPIIKGSEYDSKLGLLAMDDVCLNPTRLSIQSQDDPYLDPYTEPYWRARPGKPIQFTFALGGAIPRNMRLLLRHAGEAALGQPDYAAMRMLVNNIPYQWNASATSLYFYSNTTGSPYSGNPYGGDLYPLRDYNMQVYNLADLTRYPATITNINQVISPKGAMNTLTFEWAGGTDYLLSAGRNMFSGGATVTGIDMEVDALIYAQRGSWFVIPGRYYNEDSSLAIPWPLPQYQEPLDIRIVVDGAITENRPVSPDVEEAWLSHWRGSNLSYFTNGGTSPALQDPGNATWDAANWRWQDPTNSTTDRRMGIVYYYDATLARPVCYERDPDDMTIRYYTPRLPKLPVSPNIFSISAMRGV